MVELNVERIKELEQKIEKSKDVYRQIFDRFDGKDVRIVWSGGKDSTLTVWICRQYCQENDIAMPKAFTIDEFDTFEEIDELLKKYASDWAIDLDWGRNEDVLNAAGHKLDADVNVADLNKRN